MQVTKKLTVDLAHKYPPEMEVKSHELNKNSLFLAISLYCYGEPVTFSSETVTAALVFKGRLISGDVSCSTSGNVITLDVSAQQLAPFLLGSGVMYVELTVTVSGGAIYVLPFRFIVKVDEAIVNNAEVTPESFGTVAETVVEVFEAIGDAESLAAVIAAKLDDADGAVHSNHIASGAVTSGKIDSGAVTSGKIATEAVTNAKLASNAVNTNEIVDAAVTNAKLANGSVNASKITDGSVITSKINDSAITTAKINDGAVTTAKINDGAVSEAKLDSGYTGKTPSITVWGYDTSQANNFTVPTDFEGKLGDIVVVTTGTGTGGKIFACKKTVSAYGVTQYFWEEITLDARVSALESTVGTVNSVLQAIVDGGASNE